MISENHKIYIWKTARASENCSSTYFTEVDIMTLAIECAIAPSNSVTASTVVNELGINIQGQTVKLAIWTSIG